MCVYIYIYLNHFAIQQKLTHCKSTILQLKSFKKFKCRSFRMCLNLKDYQFKASRYNYGSIYMNPMVTTNQKPTIDTQKLRRKELKHTTKENHQITMGETKRRNEQRRTTKTTGKQVIKWQ